MPIYVKKKPKVGKPVIFALTQDEKAKIRDIFTKTLGILFAKKPDQNAWFDTLFRIRHCYEVALSDYCDQTQQEIASTLKMIEAKILKKDTDPNWMVFDEAEYTQVLDTNHAMIAMEDETTRRTQLNAIRAAKKYCMKYVGK